MSNGGQLYTAIDSHTSGATFISDLSAHWAQNGSTSLAAQSDALVRRLTAAHRDCVFPGGVIGLRFDDAPVFDFTTIKPLLDARGFRASFAVPQSYVGQTAFVGYAPNTQDAMTWGQVQQLQAEGHEITCHSRTHLDPSVNGGLSFFLDETRGAQADMLAQDIRTECFTTPGSYLAPYRMNDQAFIDYGSTDIGPNLRALFGCCEGYVVDYTGTQGHPFPCQARYGWGTFDVVTAPSGSAAQLVTAKAYVDFVVKRGSAFGQLLVHSHRLGTTGSMTLADFTALLDYIKTYVDAGQLSLASGPTALSYAGHGTPINLLDDPTFNACTTGGPYWTYSTTGSPVISAAAGKSGGNALLMTAADDAVNFLTKDFLAFGLRTLKFSAWVRNDAASGTVTARQSIAQLDQSAANVANRDVTLAAVGQAWVPFTTYVRAHPRCTKLTWRPRISGAGTIRYSDVVITKI